MFVGFVTCLLEVIILAVDVFEKFILFTSALNRLYNDVNIDLYLRMIYTYIPNQKFDSLRKVVVLDVTIRNKSSTLENPFIFNNNSEK